MTWLIPALKAVLPHMDSIISAAKPIFTKKSAPGAGGIPPAPEVQQQIAELQAAASQNAANIRELAEQLQKTVAALEQAGLAAEARLRRAIYFCAGALAVSVVSIFIALYSLFGR